MSRTEFTLMIQRKLSGILDDGAVLEWFNTPIPALNNLTPYQAIVYGRYDELDAIVESYSDSSFA